MERSLASQRELVKGRAGGRGRPTRKGSGKKGVWMEMLPPQPSLEPELPCIGSAPCGAHSAQQWDTLGAFF